MNMKERKATGVGRIPTELLVKLGGNIQCNGYVTLLYAIITKTYKTGRHLAYFTGFTYSHYGSSLCIIPFSLLSSLALKFLHECLL